MRLLTVTLAAAAAYAVLSALELSDARAEIAVLKLKNERLWALVLRQNSRQIMKRIRADVSPPTPRPADSGFTYGADDLFWADAEVGEPEPPIALPPLPIPADPLDRLGQTYTLEELIGEVFGR